MALPTDPKEFLLQHGEKVAVGVAIVISAFFLITTFTGSNASNTKDMVSTREGAIQAKMKKGVTTKGAVFDPLAQVNAEWAPLAPANLPSNWTFYRMPEVRVKRDKAALPVYVTDPTGLSAVANREQIDVNWSSPPTTTTDGKSDAALLQGYVLWKWRKGDAAEKESVFIDKSNTSYADRDFEPKTTYCYQVVAHFEFKREGPVGKTPEVLGGTVGKGPKVSPYEGQDIRISKKTEVACATTAINIKIVFRNKFGSGQGVFFVWQYWKEGRWWATKFRINTGGDVGAMVSAKQLVDDNRKYNADAAFYATLSEEKRKGDNRKKYRFEADCIYLGSGSDKSGKRVAYIEQAGIKMVGLGGLDWGHKHIVIARSKSERPK